MPQQQTINTPTEDELEDWKFHELHALFLSSHSRRKFDVLE